MIIRKVSFTSNNIKEYYSTFIEDRKRKAFGIGNDTRENAYRIYDFKTGNVKTECLHEGWQTSGSQKAAPMIVLKYS